MITAEITIHYLCGTCKETYNNKYILQVLKYKNSVWKLIVLGKLKLNFESPSNQEIDLQDLYTENITRPKLIKMYAIIMIGKLNFV